MSEAARADAGTGPEAATAAPGSAADPSGAGVGFRGFHGHLSMQARGVVALPPVLRKRYALDRPGAQVEVTEREDGVLEVRPMIAVPAREAWFWTKRWHTGEREVDAHLARGEVITSESTEDSLADLAGLDEQAAAAQGGEQPSSAPGPAAAPAAGSGVGQE